MTTPSIGEVIVRANQALLNQHDLNALGIFFDPYFVTHSPHYFDGVSGIRKLIIDSGPTLRYQLSRVIVDEEKNLGATHGLIHFETEDGESKDYVIIDIYHVEDGKILEHWDAAIALQPENPSHHTQLDGASEAQNLDQTETNRALVSQFFTDVFIDGNYGHITMYTNGDDFIQHSPNLADGAQTMRDFLLQLKDQGNPIIYKKLHRTVAQGDLVLTHSEGEFNGQRTAFFELWRVADGKIVELWNVIRAVPEDADIKHSNGIF